MTFYTILEFQCFWASTRCCERSETNFLDKKSETCQKNSSFKKSTTHMKRHENHENHICNPFIHYFDAIVVAFYNIFGVSVFWIKHQVLCEIWKKFSLSKNLRLVKKIPAPEKPQLTWRNMKIQKISYTKLIYLTFWGCYSDVLQYFRILVFWSKHKVLCEIWNNFPWQ